MTHLTSKGFFIYVLTLSRKLGPAMNTVAVLAHSSRMMLGIFVRTLRDILLFSALVRRLCDSLHYFVLLNFSTSKIAVNPDCIALEVKRRLQLVL